MTIGSAVRAIVRHPVLLAVLVVLGAASGITWSYLRGQTYVSSGRVMIGSVSAAAQPVEVNGYLVNRMTVFAGLATSGAVVSEAARGCGVSQGWLARHASAEVVPDTVIVEIEVQGGTAARARQCAARLVSAYATALPTTNVASGGLALTVQTIDAPVAGAPAGLTRWACGGIGAVAGGVLAALAANTVELLSAERPGRYRAALS